jgi:hypothetical protein
LTAVAGAAAVAVQLGPLAVRTDRATVLEFESACGGEPLPGRVPLIFPIRWLAHSEIRAHLLEVIGSTLVPVHESQSFTYARRLDLDRDYRLTVEPSRTSQPERLTLQGTVSTPDGDLCVQFETVLRLVGLDGGGAAPRA